MNKTTYDYYQSFKWLLSESGSATDKELQEALNAVRFMSHGLKGLIESKEEQRHDIQNSTR